MARRGRPTKTAKPGTRASLGLKVTPALKARIEEEAAKNGRTQSQEAEARLERSFDRADLLSDAMSLAYGPQTAGLLMVIGRAMTDAGRFSSFLSSPENLGADDWIKDPYGFEQARLAIETVMEAFRPRAEPVVEPTAAGTMLKAIHESYADRKTEAIGKSLGRGILHAIQGRPATAEMAEAAKRIKGLLGPLADVETEKEESK
jgi:hypothetical protein